MSNDTLRMDVAGSLFTSMHRNVKIKGEAPAAQNLDGTGSVSKAARHVELLSSRLNCSTSVCVSIVAVKQIPAILDCWYGVLTTAGLRAQHAAAQQHEQHNSVLCRQLSTMQHGHRQICTIR